VGGWGVRVIVAGSRHFTDGQFVFEQIDNLNLQIAEIVSGGAPGADLCGEMYAQERGIPIRRFPALWGLYGRSAGPIRNREMAEYADYLIAFTSGGPGTSNMIRTMKSLGKPMTVIQVKND